VYAPYVYTRLVCIVARPGEPASQGTICVRESVHLLAGREGGRAGSLRSRPERVLHPHR
jgi:hypothetical protein